MLRLACPILLLLLLTACRNRVLPGIGFAEDGRIVAISAADLQREAAQVVAEQLNLLLDDAWFAEVQVLDLPKEDPKAPYRDRWSWSQATVLVQVIGREEAVAPPVSLAVLRDRATEVMARATEASGTITVRIGQEQLDTLRYDARRPSWIRGLHVLQEKPAAP